MASPPPPYANVTGISRAVMKDSPQETFANYDGNARAGNFGANVSNGGANTVPVWSDGTNWYIG